MKHKGIVRRLCHSLSQGYGINEACAELGLTLDYVAKRCKRVDRVRLHQAHDSYIEGLNREVVQRARVGRKTGALKQIIDDLPLFILPGDDEDEEREHRQWRRRNFASDDDGVIVDVDNSASLSDLRRLLEILGPTDDEDDDAIETINPAKEAPAAPRRRLHANETPSALESPHPAEEPHQRRPEPAPEPEPPPESKLRWFRLYTGRAVLRAADGTIVRELMPGQLDYPHHTEFVNWE